MRKIKVLHLFNAFQVGGAERQHFLLVERLGRAFDQECWAYNQGQLERELSGLGIRAVSGDFPGIAPGIARGDYDCVVMRTHRYFREFLDLFSKIETPLIYIKDYLKWFEGNNTFIDRDFDALIPKVAAKTFFCGPLLKAGAASIGCCPPDFGMIYNGIEVDAFPMSPRTLDNGSKKMRVGILANLLPVKNQLAAIKALSEPLRTGECALSLGGDEHNLEYARLLRKESEGLDVGFSGYVSDVPAFMASIDVFLMTSIQEGWPVALMEAMACGVPVMAPDIGDIRELLDRGKAGMLYPDREYDNIPELLALLGDPKVYQEYSKAGISRVAAFDVGYAAQALENAVYAVLDGGACRT